MYLSVAVWLTNALCKSSLPAVDAVPVGMTCLLFAGTTAVPGKG